MKNTLKVVIMLAGSLGFTYGQTVKRKVKLISFPNGDESINILKDGNKEVLKFVPTEDEEFMSLQLSNHEIAHREVPGQGKRQDGSMIARGLIEPRGEKSKKRGDDSRGPHDEDDS